MIYDNIKSVLLEEFIDMNDDLQRFIDFHKRNFSYDAFVIWDLNHQCVYASELYLKYMQVKNLDKQQLQNINEDLKSFSEEFRSKVTAEVLETKKPYACYYLLKRPGALNYGLHYANVFPIFSIDKQLIAYCTRPYQMKHDLAVSNLIKMVTNKNSDYLINSPDNLTERERIVLFLLIIGMSHKEIATTLSDIFNEEVLLNSVSTLISRQIYAKFDTKVNSVLLIKAILNGFLYNIPSKLVSLLPKIIFVTKLEDCYAQWEDK